MTPLLTTPEVARLLQLSERTVYAQRHRLGGFYPAGIRALRFPREVIYAIMEGSQEREVSVSVPAPGTAVQQDWLRHSEGCPVAMVKHRESLEKQSIRPSTPTVMGFRDFANLYLDYTQRRFAEKTYKYKVIVYREFLKHTGNLPLDRISSQVIEKYLCTRPTNVNYNRHRKDLSALFAWGVKRGYLGFNPCSPIDCMPEPEFRRQPHHRRNG